MKKYLCGICVFIIGLSVLCGCAAQTLPVPSYPLDAATVTAALEDAGLPWIIAKEESWLEDHTVYTLHDQNGKMVAAVSSAMRNEQRLLYITFMPYDGKITRTMPEDEWENAIVFATILYGGFKNAHQVYDHFTNDYDTKNTVKAKSERTKDDIMGYEEVSRWADEINDVDCFVGIGQPYLNMPEKHLIRIEFPGISNDSFTSEDKPANTPVQ